MEKKKNGLGLSKEEMINAAPVPFMVHEEDMARFERCVKRLVIALIVCIILGFASNAVWLYAWNQYDYIDDTEQTITIDGKKGNANYVGGDGEINNGEDSSSYEKEKNKAKEER